MDDKHTSEFQSAVKTLSDQYQLILEENSKLSIEITNLWSALLNTRNHCIILSLVEQANKLVSSQLDSSLQEINDIINSKNHRVLFRYMCHLPMNTINIAEYRKENNILHNILDKIVKFKTTDTNLNLKILTDLINWLIYGYHTLWNDSLYDYLSVIDHDLFLNIFDLNSPDLLLDYLETLILFDCIEQIEESLEFLINSNNLSTDQFTITQATKLLWISLYARKDPIVYNLLSQTLANEDIVELQAYYYIVKSDLDNADVMNKNSTLLMLHNSSFFMKEVKDKLWGKFHSASNELSEISVSSLQEIEPKVQNKNHIENTSSIQYPDAALLYQIKRSTTQCTQCSTLLVKEKSFKIPGINKKNGKVEASVIHKLPYCPSCGKTYTYHNLTEELKKLLSGHHINVQLDPVEYKAKNKQVNSTASRTKSLTTVKAMPTTNSNKVSEFLQRFVKATPTTTVTSNKTKQNSPQPNTQITLNYETELRQLGYQITGLTRQQRWKILQNKAIPKIPLKTIVNTIANHIRLRKNQKNGETKFAYSISEWEHDLDRLKKEYYRSDFTWPKY